MVPPIIAALELKIKDLLYIPSGSRVICDPPVLTTDEDWFVWVSDWDEAAEILYAEGFSPTTEQQDYTAFISLRKAYLNICVTTDIDLYKRTVLATDLAKRFNLLNKQDRVGLFNAIQFGSLEEMKGK